MNTESLKVNMNTNLIEIINGVIEGEQDELGDLVWGVAPRNLRPAAVAVLNIIISKQLGYYRINKQIMYRA